MKLFMESPNIDVTFQPGDCKCDAGYGVLDGKNSKIFHVSIDDVKIVALMWVQPGYQVEGIFIDSFLKETYVLQYIFNNET